MSRQPQRQKVLQFPTVELAGVTYAILPATVLLTVCRQAGIVASPIGSLEPSPLDVALPETVDTRTLARRLADRRKHAGLTQGDLARRAGVRVETVNRIERGHVTPDFGTIRKLLQAMLNAESAIAAGTANRKG
jgi:DNA-binding XRE family transcriptional regulator